MSKSAETFSPYGVDLFGDVIKPKAAGPVAERFLFPPFSVLDARQGEWQERKRAWAALGIEGEVGRDAASIHCPTSATDSAPLADANFTSIFDPVVCELAYRWFCPPGGQVVDPFAGGSVRGIVAACLGLGYWGCDLRAEQIQANKEQIDLAPIETAPEWVCGDAITALDLAPPADFIFSCPPYGDLEKYSDDPADLSAMDWHAFRAAYRRIILRSLKLLKPDRFACFVVGDFRDGRGHYRNFVGDTVAAFAECGAELYNDAVLVTSVGSASMRVTRQFDAGRKFAKTHQNVLVFVKGDWRKAAAACNKS
jgi:hypothetical protein